MLWWAVAALACPPGTVDFEGFEPGLDGAVDVPTDARLVLLGNATALTVVLASEGQEPIPVTLERMDRALGGEDRVAIVPGELLAPWTQYRAEVFELSYPEGQPPVAQASVTFTTGAGPVAAPSPPVLEQLEASAWTTEDWVWFCSASSGIWRELTATVRIDEAPPRSYLLLRSEPDRPDLFLPLVAGEQVLVFPQPVTSPQPPTGRDCIEPIIVLPNGQELAGEAWCLPPEPSTTGTSTGTATGTTGDTGLQPPPPPALPEKQGFGCGMGSASSSGALAGLMWWGALWGRRRRMAR